MPEQGGGVSKADVYYQVIRDINSKVWSNFVRRMLGLPDSVIDDIENDYSRSIQEQKYQMLLRWEQMNGRRATKELLLKKAKEFNRVPGQGDGSQNTNVQESRTIAHTASNLPNTLSQPPGPNAAVQERPPLILSSEALTYRAVLGRISDKMTNDNVTRIKQIFRLNQPGSESWTASQIFYYIDDNNLWGQNLGLLEKLTSIQRVLDSLGRADLAGEINAARLEISPGLSDEQQILGGLSQQNRQPHSLYANAGQDIVDSNNFPTTGVTPGQPGKPSPDVPKPSIPHTQGSRQIPHPGSASGSSSVSGQAPVTVHVENMIIHGSNATAINFGNLTATSGGKASQKSSLTEQVHAQENISDVCKVVGEVTVTESEESFYEEHLSQEDRIYQIRSSPKGHVLILSNSEGFSWGPKHDRHGGKRDLELMKDLWTKLGFEIIIRENKTKLDMETLLKAFALQKYHRTSDLCVVVIMSHGGQDLQTGSSFFYGVDGNSIPAEDVIRLFDNDKCKALQRRPKLFFFQFCRGSTVDQGVDAADSIKEDTLGDLLTSDASDAPTTQRLPTRSDMLVAYSTFPGNKSFRNQAHGSWFINAITNVFMRGAHSTHVADLMTEVKRGLLPRTAKSEDVHTAGCKMMADCRDCLLKKLYLFPGFPQQDSADLVMPE